MKNIRTVTAMLVLLGGLIPVMTAQAQDLDLNPVQTPQNDLDRALSNPPTNQENNNFSTVNHGNYYGGLGSGSQLPDQHGQPDGGVGVHFEKRF